MKQSPGARDDKLFESDTVNVAEKPAAAGFINSVLDKVRKGIPVIHILQCHILQVTVLRFSRFIIIQAITDNMMEPH